MQIAPNPVNASATIKSPTIIQSIQVFNALGQSIAIDSDINKKEAVLHFENVSRGVYIVRIQTESGVVERRLIKE